MNKNVSIRKALRFWFYSIMETVLHWSLPPMRGELLRLLGARVGKDCVIMNCTFFNAYHYGFRTLTIGNSCFVGDEVMIDLRGQTVLEDWVSVANRVSIVTHMNVGYPEHPLQKKYPARESLVVMKRGSYIGLGAILLPGVTVGKESVVGAGAVVTKSVADHTVVAGVPARVIRRDIGHRTRNVRLRYGATADKSAIREETGRL